MRYREGLKDINELKVAYKDKIVELRKKAAVEIPTVNGSAQPAPASPDANDATSPFPAPPPPPQPQSPIKKKAGTPGLKTLDSFIDLEKVRELPQKEIEVIWRLRHAHNSQSMCAVIPLDAYKTLEQSAKKFPHFVLPVPREGQGAEMHLLQWTFPAPDTVTVLFTHLAEFKLRGEYAEAHTTITHHLELAQEKDLVLLQGQVTPGRGISVDEAKLLMMCLQKFYGFGSASPERKRLLELFGKGDPAFDVQDLINEVEKAV